MAATPLTGARQTRMLRPVRVRRMAAIILTAAALAACGVQDPGVTATRSRQNAGPDVSSPDTTPISSPGTTHPHDTTPDTTPDTSPGTTGDTTVVSSPDTTAGTTPISGEPTVQKVIDFGSSKTPRSYDQFLVKAFSDIEKFWSTQFPATYGGAFTPLSGGIFAAYKSRTEPIPGCGSAQTAYADVQGNAFYCSQGDFIVYDDDELLPQLVGSLGESAVGVVLAHEFGHAIQERAKEFDQPTILKEQQADCFAGAWAAHAARGEADGLTFGDAEIKQGLIAMIQVRDPVDGGGIADPNAHGTGFDRVGAFQDGFVGGTLRCKTFFTEAREKKLIDIPFDAADANSGNLPFQDPAGAGNDIVTLIPKDLNRFWAAEASIEGITFNPPTLVPFPEAGPFPPCDGVDNSQFPKNILYCPATNQVLVDQDLAKKLDANPLFGDLSIGYLVGEAYSEAVQVAMGSKLQGKDRVLLSDCFTGAWTRDDIPPLPADRAKDGISLSAGDLDEAVITAITRSDDSSSDNARGTAFEKIDAFRTGVLGGLAACKSRLTP
jgi:predicted metalloprotease